MILHSSLHCKQSFSYCAAKCSYVNNQDGFIIGQMNSSLTVTVCSGLVKLFYVLYTDTPGSKDCVTAKVTRFPAGGCWRRDVRHTWRDPLPSRRPGRL